MKKIECIIRTHKFDEVREALEKIDLRGMTVTEVLGYGRQKGHDEHYRGVEYQNILQKKLKLEILIPDAQTDEVIRTVQATAKTGKFGDGKILVTNVEDLIRIRTGDWGEFAL